MLLIMTKGVNGFLVNSLQSNVNSILISIVKKGFGGSAGVAVVTLTEAALWTDSRYFIRADEELDHNYWTLQKQGDCSIKPLNNYFLYFTL